MHTAHVSDFRFALLDYFQEEDSEEPADGLGPSRKPDPHILEHETRAAELMEDDDEDAAMIHQLLNRNIKRASGKSN